MSLCILSPWFCITQPFFLQKAIWDWDLDLGCREFVIYSSCVRSPCLRGSIFLWIMFHENYFDETKSFKNSHCDMYPDSGKTETPTYTLAWPHFRIPMKHTQMNVDFCHFFYLICSDLIMKLLWLEYEIDKNHSNMIFKG